jgi:hypothetical protein
MDDEKTLEANVMELQQKLQREFKIRQAADQMLSTTKGKGPRTKIKEELDKCMKRITVYSNDLERLGRSLSVSGDTVGIEGRQIDLIH